MIYTYKNEYEVLVDEIEDDIFDNLIEEYPELIDSVEEYTEGEVSKKKLLRIVKDRILEDTRYNQFELEVLESKEYTEFFDEDEDDGDNDEVEIYDYDITSSKLAFSHDEDKNNASIDLYDIRNRYMSGDKDAINELFDYPHDGLKTIIKDSMLSNLINSAKYAYKSNGKNMNYNKKKPIKRNQEDKNNFKWLKSFFTSVPEEETESTIYTLLFLLLQGKKFVVLNNGDIDFDIEKVEKYKTDKERYKNYEDYKKYKSAIIFPQEEITNKSLIYKQLVYSTIKMINNKYRREDIEQKCRLSENKLKERMQEVCIDLEKYGISISDNGRINKENYSHLSYTDKEIVDDLVITWKKINTIIEGSNKEKDSNGKYINKWYIEGYIPPEKQMIPKEIEDETITFEGGGNDESYSVSKFDNFSYLEFIRSSNYGYQKPYKNWRKKLKNMNVDTVPYFTSDEQKEYIKFYRFKYKIGKDFISDDDFLELYFKNEMGIYKNNYEKVAEYFGVSDKNIIQIFGKIRNGLYKYFDEYDENKLKNKLSFTFEAQYLWWLYIHLSGEGQSDILKAEDVKTGKIRLLHLTLFKKYLKEDNGFLLNIFSEYYDKFKSDTDLKGNVINKKSIKTIIYNTIKGNDVLVTRSEAGTLFFEIAHCISYYLDNKVLNSIDINSMYWDDDENYKDYSLFKSGEFKDYLKNTKEKIKAGIGYDYVEKRQFKEYINLWEIEWNKDKKQNMLYFYKAKYHPLRERMPSQRPKQTTPYPIGHDWEIKYNILSSDKCFYLIDNTNMNKFQLFNEDRVIMNGHDKKISYCGRIF